PDWDELRVAALKKQKLRIKDELARLRAGLN
ncbi:MAG: YdcH family protein, partial [Alphaproteobacteria bacterium]|nr:YdcH family protein [Alphaproteobacteria bacterium]